MRVAIVALLLVACTTPAATDEARSTASPEAATATRTAIPSGPVRSARLLRSPQPLPSASPPSLVLSYERYSDIPVARGPEVLVTSDGQMISADNFTRALMARRLTAAGIDSLRKAVLDTGLFTESRSLGRRALPGASPNLNRGYEALEITFQVGDRAVRVSTFARDPDDGLYRWDPGREELLALAARLTDLSWLPASAWLDPTPRPYAATFHRLYIEMARNVLGSVVSISVEDLWPFVTAPESFGELVALDPASAPNRSARCAVLTADDARSLGESIVGPSYHPDVRGSGGTFRWPAGNGEVLLQIEPLLPHVPPTCAGVRRLVF